MEREGKTPDAAALRRLAEERVVQQARQLPADEAERQRLLHELLVHQVELELQNDELKRAQDEALEALRRESGIREHLDELVAGRTRELRLAMRQAELASVAKNAFLANMSHELRTPLNAIMGMTALALQRAADPKQQEYLEKAMAAARSLTAILSDIIEISQIEAERLELERIQFSVDTVVHSVMDAVGQKGLDKGLSVHAESAPELGRRCWVGDPLRLSQILSNLVGNAVKFTEHGSIRVSVRQVRESAHDVVLRFEVMDTGIGISPEDQLRLFTAFEQADNSASRRFGGTGLGLAICRHLVQLMGGQIGVDSAPGLGSSFWFTVRLDKAAESCTGGERPAADSPGERLRTRQANLLLLVAEDDPLGGDVLRGLLVHAGCGVTLATEGQQAVSLARQQDYDLVLIDLAVPSMGGLEAARLIRTLPGHADLPIVAISANASGSDRQACLNAGINDHLVKPVAPDALFATLLKWLANQHRAG